MNTPMGQSTVGEMLPFFIIIGVLLLFVVFCIFMAVKTSKLKKAAKAQRKQEMTNRNAKNFGTFNHFTGLPIPENTMCQVFSTPEEIQILANGQQFNLQKVKMLDVSMKTDVEIQKQTVSSAGGAVGGALLFGAVGALIGGRAKTKTTREVYTYLIFSYQKDNESQYIAFNVTGTIDSAQKFIQEFKASPSNQVLNIDL